MKEKKINSNNIMSTILMISIIVFSFFGGIHFVNADESIEYEKSFVSIEIESGDTLTALAQEYAISEADYEDYIEEVKSINNLKDDVIHHGCYLLIPVYDSI